MRNVTHRPHYDHALQVFLLMGDNVTITAISPIGICIRQPVVKVVLH